MDGESLFATINARDLDEHGMSCEACGEPFSIGDQYVSQITGFTGIRVADLEPLMTPEQRAEVDDWSGYVPLIGDFRCRSCFEEERPVRIEEGNDG